MQKKTGSGPLGKTGSTLFIIVSLLILVWAYRTCQKELPADEERQEVPEPKAENFPVIFIAVDSLNMRNGPHLDSSIVAKLRIGDPILYLNEKTDFRQKINFDGLVRNDPWVKIKTREGLEGWIYAAGARFYDID